MNQSRIFANALKIHDPSARAAFLDRVCEGNQRLRDDVQELLQAHERDPNFLEQPVIPGTTVDHVPLPDLTGTVLTGRYKLLEKIGEGGMGEVWMAQQIELVKRFVAVKLIKEGTDSKQRIARFEAERQALTLMDHPNIAKVFDGGVYQPYPGSVPLPFFVMELVKGRPISTHCDELRLTPRERLELFIPVCHAIHHAHQKGIIHRDIKPSNVMVAMHDNNPVPIVIDFGIAKATGQPLTDLTLHTAFAGIVGTLSYMSPEQAGFNQLDVDTRSDVYSLGVLLYELLTGNPPFSPESLQRAGIQEAIRLICEQEPPKPSTKLSTAEGLPKLAEKRSVEPKGLSSLVKGELDWITMKSLEKDRNRRYDSAKDLALDIQRYLNNLPVSAGPPAKWYRLKKFAGRHRTALLAVVVVLIALLGGTALATWQALRASKAEATARLSEKQAIADREEANEKRREAQTQRERAEIWLRETQTIVTQYIGVIRTSKELHEPGRKALLERLLEPARVVFEKLVQEECNDPGLRAEYGRIFGQLGLLFQTSGRLHEAENANKKALEILEEAASTHPDNVQYQNDLAVTWNNFGHYYDHAKQPEKALEAFARADVVYQKLLTTHQNHSEFFDFPREHAECLYNRGEIFLKQRDYPNAEAAYARALELVKDRTIDSKPKSFSLSGAIHNSLGVLHERTGFKEKAIETYEKARSINEQLSQRYPKSAEYQQSFAVNCFNMGTVYQGNEQYDKARDAYRQAIVPLQRLLEEYPNVPEYNAELARIHNNLGIIAHRSAPKVKDAASFAEAEKFYAEAEKSYLEAMKLRRKLVRNEPEHPEYPQSLADSLRNLVVLYLMRSPGLVNLNRSDEAQVLWERILVEVKALPESEAIKGETLFMLAYHVAWSVKYIPENHPKRGEYPEQAMRLLRRTREAGYFNDPAGLKELKEHVRLNSLRQRADFQKFLEEVQRRER